MKNKIRNICKDVLPLVDLDSSDFLVDSGIIDSLDIIALVGELSQEFNVEFDIDDLIPKNFNSLDAMVNITLQLLAR